MTDSAFIVDPEATPYNVAYLVDDRSHLYHEYDVDRDLDDGPERPERDAPADYAERRTAILAFYGERCGRCGTAVGRHSTDEVSLGYVYSVATREDPTWQLSNLVAVCEPCYDLLSATACADLETFGDAYRRSPQFPTWAGDPRVAVERHPLTGREAWLRATLAERIDDQPRCSINTTVARRVCLARTTPAAEAVALGTALVQAERGALSTANRRLRDRWNALTTRERDEWTTSAVDPDTSLVAGAFEPATARHST